MIDLGFKGRMLSEFNVYIVRRASIPAPEREYTETYIKGRDGALVRQGALKDILIPVECNYLADDNELMTKARAVKAHFIGSGKLIFTDDTDVYYRVKHADVQDFARVSNIKATFKITFTCSPYAYDNASNQVQDFKQIIYNKGALCEPIYELTGSGECNIIVNGKSVTVTVIDKAIIDIEKRSSTCAYKGDLTDLCLPTGKLDIRVSNNFNCRITPNWRYL